MKCLVLGAGFLGKEIVSVFRKKGVEVLPSRISGEPTVLDEEVLSSLKIDVLDADSLKRIPLDVTHIVYCVSAKDGSVESYENAYYLGLKNVVDYLSSNLLRERVSFCFISSSGVFREDEGKWVDEDSEVLDDDEKYSSILRGEQLVLSTFKEKGLALRLSGIYGEGRRYFIKLAETLALKDQTEIHMPAPRWSNRIHKYDAARAVLHLFQERQGGLFNVSDLKPSVNIDTLCFIQELLKVPIDRQLSLSRDAVDKGKRCDCKKLLRTGFSFNYASYKEGYRDLLNNTPKDFMPSSK